MSGLSLFSCVGRAMAAANSARRFSTPPMRRPPPRAPERGPSQPKPIKPLKWRSHAVSLELASYPDIEKKKGEAEMESRKLANEQILLERYKKEQAEKKAQKEKWLKQAEPTVRVPIIDEQGNSQARGTRKTAHASVYIHPGFGHVVVNGKDITEYFGRDSDREHLLAPLVVTDTCGRFDVTARTHGGGLRGQAGAIRLALARALNNYNPEYRPPLKRLGYLTRDPRMVERKKVGRVKARKKPQWVRR